MRVLNYFMAALALVVAVGCEPVEQEQKEYPELTSLDNTLWYSYDSKKSIFYDIIYYENGEGVMLGYSDQERTDEVVNRPFDYTFTPATEKINAIVRVNFEDGQLYGGALVPKGYYQVNLQDVYLIQLYEVDTEGEPIKDDMDNYLSIIQMWNDEPQIQE
jgi:hypothetical protein